MTKGRHRVAFAALVAGLAVTAMTFPVAAAPGRSLAQAGPPAWPAAPVARADAPNVLVIMTDDVGFGSSSTFGGPVPTPTFDALAREGLRYNQFNTTALCSPTRAALLTGHIPNNAEMGTLTNTPTSYDGYTGIIPRSTATVAWVLHDNGYATAAFGKWHLTPEWETSRIGPFDRWPTGMGFDHFYGFLAGSTDQFAPGLYEDTLPIDPPADDPDYILDRDLADRTIGWIRGQHAIAPDRPFLAYYATGTAHGPLQAPREWLVRFRGKFDGGWDAMREEIFARQKQLGVIPANAVLTARPAALPAWTSLTPDQKQFASRLMESYAAALSHADYQIGRIVQSLKDSGQYENTLIIYIQGDNGSSGEGGLSGLVDELSMVDGTPESPEFQKSRIDDLGGPRAYAAYPAGWGWAMNTPFQYYKQVASHLGGVRNGMVMSWPRRIKDAGGLRTQFHYVSDIMPTILDVAGVKAPRSVDGVAQKPIDGVSMTYSFDSATAPSHRRAQVFAMAGNFGVYHDGWWAGTSPVKPPWDLLKPGNTTLGGRTWELYNLDQDFSQARNLAGSDPVRLVQLQKLFLAEAGRNRIAPDREASEGSAGRPSLAKGRNLFIYAPGSTRIPENAAPSTLGRSFTITADVELPQQAVNGVLATQGGRFGGYSFYVKNGRPVFHYNAIGPRQYVIAANEQLTAGAHKISASFSADRPERGSGGSLTLAVDGKPIAQGRIEATLKGWISLSEGLDVGEDRLTPIGDDYAIENNWFSGKLNSVSIELK